MNKIGEIAYEAMSMTGKGELQRCISQLADMAEQAEAERDELRNLLDWYESKKRWPEDWRKWWGVLKRRHGGFFTHKGSFNKDWTKGQIMEWFSMESGNHVDLWDFNLDGEDHAIQR